MAEATNSVTVAENAPAETTVAAKVTPTGKRKQRIGEVVSNKMTKTIVVRVERRFPHPQFKKIITSYKKFYAHDEKAEAKVGDTVRIEESRPLSKLKRWKLIEVVERGVQDTAVVA
jgi:small subunit ribosomal protein S17